MRLHFEFGHKGRHSVAAQNEALQEAVKALAGALKDERAAHDDTRAKLEGLKKAVLERARKANETTWEIPIVHGGKARFQMMNGALHVQ